MRFRCHRAMLRVGGNVLCIVAVPMLCVLALLTPAYSQVTEVGQPIEVQRESVIRGNIVDNSGLIPFDQAYFQFEVENVLDSLKGTPIWDELEQMLDDPYAIALEPSLGLNTQGFPSYISTLPRRRSYIYRNAAGAPCAPGAAGCVNVPLPPLVIHAPNYNYMNGEELRLLNVGFEGADWEVPDQLVLAENPTGDPADQRLEWTYKTVTVSSGEERIEEDEAAIDFNSPYAPDDRATTITNVEIINGQEGQLITGGDPGEPGYAGFGFLRGAARRPEQYSTPAIPLNDLPAAQRVPGASLVPGFGSGQRRLFDPARGFINRRNPTTGAGGLRKPSLRIPPYGRPNSPGFAVNSAANLEADPAALVPSNENDYMRSRGAQVAGIPTGREAAVVLGKALFWDMQVGSDAVQSCGSCHFHAGADNRVKNQVNPNHLGDDKTFQIRQPNESLRPEDFPFHKLNNPATAGEGLDVVRDVNDVASSMGVFFRLFQDIPAIGSFNPPTPSYPGVRSVLPDLGAEEPDPIPGFQGLRRVEPRNTPTLFGAAMNFDNFWDGRARHDFNGGSVFGAADPQHHVFVNADGSLTATRQIIRFASLASLATGPGLSDFEMSWSGRNWAKIAKKLLQAGTTPLANQLVDPNDSVLGPYSNQRQTVGGPVNRAGRPGLNVSYAQLIRAAFAQPLWNNDTQHLEGCYTDGKPTLHPNQCSEGTVAIPVLSDTDADGNGDVVVDGATDPFDNFVLSIAGGVASPGDTDQFSQMEANFPLFFGLSVHLWGTILVPDDSPMDRFYDVNPSAFLSFGEANEKFLVPDLLNCSQTGNVEPCFREVERFKRDPNVSATMGVTAENGEGGVTIPAGGTRTPTDPDPLFGMDLFLGSNLSLKNPLYRSFRCGECHAQGTLTDHTFDISHQISFNDFFPEFESAGREVFPEPLGRSRVINGFSLEGEINGNAQDAIERNLADFALDEMGAPQGQALFDNGIYNIGVTRITSDISRGGNDAFGWPLSLGVLALKNLGGVGYTPGGHLAWDGFALPDYPGIPLPNFDPSIDPTGGGLFEETAQDQQINPGFEEEPADPKLPAYLAPWASNINVGDEVQQDELFIGLNTLCEEPILEGFVDTFGPFNPAGTVGENFNSASQPQMATWPVVNRVNRMGSFKAPTLRNVELTGPYFHNGGNLTLRQQLDFYLRGGNFPITNSAHRDFLIMNLNIEDEALGGVDPVTGQPAFTEAQKEHAKASLIDFLLELTDERVRFARAPFDHPELFVPLDGRAPINTFGRGGFVNQDDDPATGSVPPTANPMFRHVAAVGQGGLAQPLKPFLDIESGPRLVGDGANCGPAAHNHYCR